MNEAVDRVIIERAAFDEGWPGSLVLSLLAHTLVVGGGLALSLLASREPPIRVVDGFAVEMPRGGRGERAAEAPAPAAPEPAPPVTAPPAPKPEPEKILKPPKEDKRKGLPELDSKKKKPKTDKTPPPKAVGGVAGGTGTSAKTPGIEWAPAGPGLPDGTDFASDWYLATVQQKIWMSWTEGIRAGMAQPVIVAFSIEADGSVTDVEVVQSCGVALVDNAAKRAVFSSAPFGPLPNHYGTKRITIQGIFKPTS